MRLIPVLLALMMLALAPPAQARLIEAQGAAEVLDGDIAGARDRAVQQAAREALLKATVRIDATSVVSANELMADSVRISTAGRVKDIVVLREWIDGAQLKVQIRAQVLEDKSDHVSPAAHYRKKVAITQFQVLDRGQIFDIPDVERDLARELLRRMENTGAILAVDGSSYLAPFPDNDRDRMPDIAAAVSELAGSLNAQFLVTSVIRDMGVNHGLLTRSRRLVLEVNVYDGISGALLSRRRINESVDSAGLYTPAIPFGSVESLQSNYGRALDQMLDRLSRGILLDLAPLPFSAQVIRQEGEEVYFDAGALAKVKVGDVLMTYQLAPQPLQGSDHSFMGYQESPATAMVVKRVQPLFAVGELRDSEITLKAGDRVRFGL